MKKKKIGGYPGLCLCLIVLLSMPSCAINHDVKTVNTLPQTRFWVINAVILAGDIDHQVSGIFDLVSIKPYMVENIFNPGQPKMLFLSFRVHNVVQVQSLRETLFDTAVVTQINIIPPLTN